MRLWTNTGLYIKGGAGGLLLDTGAGPSFLPLPPSVLDQITSNNDNNCGNPTIIRMPDVAGTLSRAQLDNIPVLECDIDVCFVCKKCRVAFPSEGQLINHHPQCYASDRSVTYFGSFRIVQTGYECQLCPASERCKSLQDLRKHCETEGHLKVSCALLPPPSESPLSHEMEDVVNQITLLAARAAAAQEGIGIVGVPQTGAIDATSVAGRALDSNAIAFCQAPGEPKRRFLVPGGDVAAQQQPITRVTH